MSKKFYKYLIMLLLTFCFTYIFEVKELYILLYILFVLPLIDIISLKFFLSRIQGDIIINDLRCAKHDFINFEICITNKSFLQINNAVVNISYEGAINGDKTCINDISVERKNDIFLRQKLKAIHIGIGVIKLQSISIKGLFGLFKSNIMINKEKEINIEPRVIDICGYDKFVYNSNYKEGNSFNNKEFAGELDTEYKNYEFGEPVNKINWKISSKEQALLMRKNVQKYKRDNIVLILNTYVSKDGSYYNVRDKLIENFLGLVNNFYKDKFQVRVYIYSSTEIKKIEVSSDIQFKKLREYFVNYEYTDEYNNLEKLQLDENDSNYVIVTTDISNQNKVMINNVSKYINRVSICIICTNNYNKMQRKFSNSFDIYHIDETNTILQ